MKTSLKQSDGFHVSMDRWVDFFSINLDRVQEYVGLREYFTQQTRTVNYRFYLHQHPWVQELMQRLVQKGIRGLQNADTEYDEKNKPVLLEEFFNSYNPNEEVVSEPYPVKDLDFS